LTVASTVDQWVAYWAAATACCLVDHLASTMAVHWVCLSAAETDAHLAVVLGGSLAEC
jgi:hypothetical protein